VFVVLLLIAPGQASESLRFALQGLWGISCILLVSVLFAAYARASAADQLTAKVIAAEGVGVTVVAAAAFGVALLAGYTTWALQRRGLFESALKKVYAGRVKSVDNPGELRWSFWREPPCGGLYSQNSSNGRSCSSLIGSRWPSHWRA
jgi:hypothetical protein